MNLSNIKRAVIVLAVATNLTSAFADLTCASGVDLSVLAQCQVVQQGQVDTGVPFSIQSANFCIQKSVTYTGGNNGQTISLNRYDVSGEVSGQYLGSTPSKDSVVPEPSTISSFQPGQTMTMIDPYLRFTAYTQQDGSDYKGSDSDGLISNGSLNLSSKYLMMIGQYEQDVRSTAIFDPSRKTLDYKYERQYALFFGGWKTMFHVHMQCQ